MSTIAGRRMPRTLSRAEVPLLFQEPHVEQGFRQLHQPWHYYLLSSVMQLHNESMNVWTHMLACGLHYRKLQTVSEEVDFLNDPWTWPLLAGMLCGVILYACSAAAHCFQARSELTHYTAFMFDYSGIGMYGLGSIILHMAYCSENDFYEAVSLWFIPVGCLLSFAITFCCTVAKVIYRRPYPPQKKIWQITPIVFIYCVLISPILHRLGTCQLSGVDCTESIPYHISQMGWFFISGMFFALDVPQRWMPGKCDYFFHSHQLFHIAIMICTLYQMDAVYLDFHERRAVLEATRPTPTLLSAFGPVVLVVTAMLTSIYIFYRLIKHKLHGGEGLAWLKGVVPIHTYQTVTIILGDDEDAPVTNGHTPIDAEEMKDL